MSIKARKKHEIIKAKGVAKYCHLNEPNKKFDPEFGVYSCDLIIDKEQADAIKQKLRPLYEEELKQVQEENQGKKIEQKEFPIKEEEGGFLVKSKLKAGGRRRKIIRKKLFSIGNKLASKILIFSFIAMVKPSFLILLL